MDWPDYEFVKNLVGEPFAQQFTIWTTSLALASWIHSGRVTKSINNLAAALTGQLDSHSKKIEKVESGLNDLSGRVSKLEIVKEK